MRNKLLRFIIISSWGFSVTALICSFLRVDVHITHESFIGIIATFIGVIATFIVGFQIYNVIENNTKLKNYESSQKELRLKILQNKEIFIGKLNKLENQINTNSIVINQELSKHKYEITHLKSQLDLYTPHIEIPDWNSLVSTILVLDKNLNDNVEAFAQILLSESMVGCLDLIDAQQNNKSISLSDNLHMSVKIINKFHSNLKKKEQLIKSISPESSHTLNQLMQKIKKLKTTTHYRYLSYNDKYSDYF